jgi:hypothetical protein
MVNFTTEFSTTGDGPFNGTKKFEWDQKKIKIEPTLLFLYLRPVLCQAGPNFLENLKTGPNTER